MTGIQAMFYHNLAGRWWGNGALVQIEPGFRIASLQSPIALFMGFLLAPDQFTVGGEGLFMEIDLLEI